jgi:hypothetical protein
MNYYSVVYMIFILTFIITSLLGLPKYGKTFALIAMITFGTSYLFYGKGHLVGEIWCYYVVFIPLIYYLGRTVYYTNQK